MDITLFFGYVSLTIVPIIPLCCLRSFTCDPYPLSTWPAYIIISSLVETAFSRPTLVIFSFEKSWSDWYKSGKSNSCWPKRILMCKNLEFRKTIKTQDILSLMGKIKPLAALAAEHQTVSPKFQPGQRSCKLMNWWIAATRIKNKLKKTNSMKISEHLLFICLKVAALWNWLWIPPTCLIYLLNKDISPWFEYGFHSHMEEHLWNSGMNPICACSPNMFGFMFWANLNPWSVTIK